MAENKTSSDRGLPQLEQSRPRVPTPPARVDGGRDGRRPGTPTTAERASWLLIALVIFMLIGWGLGVLCRSLGTIDLRAVHDVASDRTRGQIALAHVFSWIGSGWVVFPLTLVCALILYRQERRARALVVTLSTAGAVAIANLDKLLVARPRPPVRHLETVTSWSFPSGHAAQTAALCMALVLAIYATERPRWLKIAAAVAGLLLVLAVAISRVYLGVHYPSDVVFGALLGVSWATVAGHYITAPVPRRWAWRRGIAGTVVVLVGAGAVVTAASFLDQLSWVFEAVTMFNLQYAVLLVVAAMFAAGLRRWRLAGAAALLAAINVAIIAPWPWQSAPPTAAAATDPTFRIVSFNLDSTNHRFGDLEPMIRQLRPDILGLTEVTPGWAQSAEHASSRVRPRLLVVQPGDYGLGILSVTRPVAITAERFPAPNGPIALVSRFRIAGRPVTFLMIHLHTPFAGYVHAQELNAIAAARASFGPRLIACGDFNTVPWSAQLGEFAETTRLTDVFGGSWPPWTWPSWSWLLRTPLDHCLISDGLAVRHRRIGPSIGSDHFSLVIDIAVTALHR